MKKFITILLSGICMFTFCSCGAPISCTIAEMNYELPNDYTLESDQEIANGNFDDTLELESGENTDGMTAEDYLALQWYSGSDYDLSVTAMYASYKDSEFEDAVEAICNTGNGNYKEFNVNSAIGRHGTYKVKSSTNYGIDLLNNGVLYSFTFFNAEDISDQVIQDIIASINFDNTLLSKHTVECGDYQMKLDGEYQPLTTDDFDEDEYQDIVGYGKFGKGRIDFSVNFFDGNKYKSASEMGEYMKGQLDDSDYSEETEDFGKCYYVYGNYDGTEEAVAIFENDNKVYMVSLTSNDSELSLDDIKEITKTIKKVD